MFRSVRGMKDLYGLDFDKYNYLVQKSIEIGRKHGYNVISTPIVEYTDVFQRAMGNETDVVSKEMYTFVDKGNESITLRPEGTAGVMRAIVSENMTQSLPLKLMYYGEMFRYDRPQKGRFRQFHQVGFEHVGDKSPYTDAVCIALAAEILNNCGLFDFKVYVNTLGDDETRADYTKAIVKFLSRHESDLSEESKIRLKKNPLRILDSKDKGDKEICSMAPIIVDYVTKEAGAYFEKVCQLLSDYGINYEIDNFLVRGLDYYSYTAFEIKSTSAHYKESIGGGGRYDKLLNIFGGPDVSGVGFAFGAERIMMLLQDSQLGVKTKKVAVIPVSDEENDSAFDLLKLLYNCDISAEFIHVGNLSKKMKIANRLNCDIALILGEEEYKNKTITAKFMNQTEESSKTKVVNINEIVRFIKCC